MIKRISHIGVAVKNLGPSKELFSKLLGNNSPHTEKVEAQNATVSFYPIGESSIELIESAEPAERGSSIAKFIEKRGEGIHHICLEVDDIEVEIHRLKKLGFQFVNETPSPGSRLPTGLSTHRVVDDSLSGEGCIVAFLHPKSTNGVLIELSQNIGQDNAHAK
jgi:methylmalonyl-CoA/ethylmalonyl-CoA epimerase